MAKASVTKTSVEDMSDTEILDFVTKRKAAQRKLASEKAYGYRAELDAYCQKQYGLSMAQIFTARDPSKPPAKSKPGKGAGAA
jgi:hypothetical protein